MNAWDIPHPLRTHLLVLAVLEELGSQNVPDLTDLLADHFANQNSMRAALRKMLANGYIERTDARLRNASYQLTERGQTIYAAFASVARTESEARTWP